MIRTIFAIFVFLALMLPAIMIAPIAVADGEPTTSITVTKFAADDTTVMDSTTVDIPTMEGTLPVQGDGITHYWMQGPTFDPGNILDPDETLNLKDKGAVQGTDVKDLCELVGGASPGDTIRIQAEDGYGENFTYETIYSPVPDQGPMVMCWKKDGAYSGAGYDEGIQLVFFAQTANGSGQFVFGNQDMHDCLPEDNWHYYFDGGTQYFSCNGVSIKWIDTIEIYTSGASEWDLQLNGAINYTMSQNDFQNGVACHGEVTWEDGDDTWSGMPLWLLCGWVDDTETHGPGSFNDTLAAAGYEIIVSGSDGYNRTFASADVARNDDIIVANKLNGQPLPADRFPLRLVGPGLGGADKVSQIVSIDLVGIPWALELDGAENIVLPQGDFENHVVANGVQWVESGSDVWKGLALWRLVGMMDDNDPDTFNDALAADGYEVKVIAMDDYSKTFSGTEVARNDDMIVANTYNDAELPQDAFPLKLVGPGLSGGQKVRNICRIEIVGLGDTDWQLDLFGAQDYTMTQTEFEEGVDCHGAVTWVDGDDTWSGMPLWLLCGWVDDANQHDAGAFNDALAAEGYEIVVTGSDGFNYTFNSGSVSRNNDIIVANRLNGMPLPPDRYPLRVVGPMLAGFQKVGQIVSIELTSLPWALELDGVENIVLPQGDFENHVAANGVQWVESGSDVWNGLALWRLVGMMDDQDPNTFNDALAAEGYEVKVIAMDDYSRTFSGTEVARNDDMIVANTYNDAELPQDAFPLKLVGPGLSGGQKVRNICRIEIVGLGDTDWQLDLFGAQDYTMTQTEFEEGVDCHGAVTWVDGDDTWSGMPLWLLCGWVDDANQHDAGAFNDALAAEGYEIVVTGSDGFNYTFNSGSVSRNNDIIVANRLNGMPLPPDRYPLRVVGPMLAGFQKVGQIVSIELHDYSWTPWLYDFNINGAIEYNEMVAALLDYLTNEISYGKMVDVLMQYLAGP